MLQSSSLEDVSLKLIQATKTPPMEPKQKNITFKFVRAFHETKSKNKPIE